MAQKRMFSLSVVDTDTFLEMPLTSRLLYYELGMRADDDGFVDDWKKILKFTGLAEDDMKVLIAKKFIIPFESGVIVIRHWRLNNYLRNDRHTSTIHKNEYDRLIIEDGVYELESTENSTMLPGGIPGGIPSIDKNSIDKNSIDNIYTPFEQSSSGDVDKKTKHKYGKYKHVLLTDEENTKLHTDYENAEELIEYLDEYIEMKGYKAKSHYLCIKKWVVSAVAEQRRKSSREEPKKEDKWAKFMANQREGEEL